MSTATLIVARPSAGVGRRATRDILPIAVAVVPFGAVIGVTLNQAGLTGLPALTATALLYAGSAQLATLSVLISGGGPLSAVIAGVIVNTRMLLYSAGLSRRFRHQPAWFRWVAPLTTVDQTFALASQACQLDRAEFRRYWTAMGAVLAAVWLSAVTFGMVVGGVLPEHSPLEVAAPAVMVSLLVPHLGVARMRRAAMTAATVAVAGRFLPAGLGIVAAIVVALAVAGPDEENDR